MGYQVGEWIMTDNGKTGYIEYLGYDKAYVRYTLNVDGEQDNKTIWGAHREKRWPLNGESVYQRYLNPMPIEKYYCEDVVELALVTRDFEWLKELAQLRGEKLK